VAAVGLAEPAVAPPGAQREPPEVRAGQAQVLREPDPAPTREWGVVLPADPVAHQRAQPIRIHLQPQARGQAVPEGPVVPEQVQPTSIRPNQVRDRRHLQPQAI
jgi:hypothetical protein